MKRLLTFSAVLLVIAAACVAIWRLSSGPQGKDGAQQRKTDYRVAAILQSGDNNYFWERAWEGARKAASDNKLYLSEYTYMGRDEIEELLETALLSGVNAVIMAPPLTVTDNMKELFEKARRAGVYLIFVDANEGQEYRDVFVGVDNESGGRALADAICARFTKGQRILLLVNYSTMSNAISVRRNSFVQRLAQLGMADALTSKDFKRDDTERLRELQNLLKNEELPDYIVTISPGSTNIAANTVERLGLSDEVSLFGFGEDEKTLAYVEKGTIKMLFAQDSALMGEIAVKEAYNLLDDKKAESAEHLLDLITITPENIHDIH